MLKNKQKTIVDYLNKDKFMKFESFDEKTPLEIKGLISKLSSDCISNSSDQTKKLKELYSILESKTHGKSIILRKCVLVSLCLIYKDILPTYKITILSDEQKQQKMRNETIKCYSDEEILLGHYYKFVRVMESVIKRKYDIVNLNHIHWTESDELTLLKCACELFTNNPDFNYSTTLLKLIIPNLNSTNSKFLKPTSKTIEMIIKSDMKLSLTLKVCEEIKQYSIDNAFNIRATLLKPLIFINLEDTNSIEVENQKSEKKSLISRKEKKINKKNKKISQQVAQVTSKESINIKNQKSSQIVRILFYIFFRILKKNNIPSKLLESILEGIKKFGRLVNCDLFHDIFSYMTKISQNSKVSLDNRLRSVYVCLDILTSGKASDILDIDPGKFCDSLINLIQNAKISDSSAILILNCSTKLLVKRRNYISINNASNLIKNLIKLACNEKDSCHISSTILVSVVRYLRIYPQLQYIFDDEVEEFDEIKTELNNETLSILNSLCKLSVYEVAGPAKRIKKFFNSNNCENSLYELGGTLEELTRMKTEMCLEHLKEKLRKPLKRINNDDDECESFPKKTKYN